MNLAESLRQEIAGLGYPAIRDNYIFSDVFASPPRDRTAPLAAFSHTPPSYRNAALAVVANPDRSLDQLALEYRALGAPLLFVITGDEVTAWQVRAQGTPRFIARATQNELAALFVARRDAWTPQSIQRAKSIGQFDRSYQLDFVDAGLLPAIEGEIHEKLDRLLNETLAEASSIEATPHRVSERTLFRTVFRLLAAKILHDRSHSLAQSWNPNDITTVLDATSRYYDLPLLAPRRGEREYSVFTAAWESLQRGINFQNISSDDLAFVYENTLITPATRKKFGTHSTPWQVVEYVVSRLGLRQHSPEQLSIYEPCSGAAVFLVSALRNLREELPINWTDQQRHKFLIERLFGDEIDSFAVEVAKLSLILADYPNHNGWQIREVDLFEEDNLSSEMSRHNIVVCNPPFGMFTKDEREKYSVAKPPYLKPGVILNAALDAHPLALGFVLPRGFILEPGFAEERKRVEQLYSSIELVELPDNTFRESEAGAALLIARDRRTASAARVSIISTEVGDHDRLRFLKTGETTTSRRLARIRDDQSTGNLWTPRLAEVWEYLKEHPRLDNQYITHLGARWKYPQQFAVSESQKAGFARGLFNADDVLQFKANQVRYIDLEPSHLTHATSRPWSSAKVIMNAVRTSRGPWRISAMVDRNGLAFSQQLLGLWPRDPADKLEMIAAILNGPIGNAFIATQSPSERIRLSTLASLPLPRIQPRELEYLVNEYVAALDAPFALGFNDRLQALLTQIDASVLAAYDLPPRYERELLEFFRDGERPTIHEWRHWLPERFGPFIPLHHLISQEYQKATTPWIEEVLTPLPSDEAAKLREYMD